MYFDPGRADNRLIEEHFVTIISYFVAEYNQFEAKIHHLREKMMNSNNVGVVTSVKRQLYVRYSILLLEICLQMDRIQSLWYDQRVIMPLVTIFSERLAGR